MFENFLGAKKPVFGLDIGHQSLKIAYLKRGRQGVSLLSFAEIPSLTAPLQKNGIKDKKKIAEILQKGLKEAEGGPIPAHRVASALPESLVFTKSITLPKMKVQELQKTIPYEAADFLPIAPEEVYLDWQITGEEQKNYEILVIAAPRRLVDDYVLLLQSLGLELTSLETKPIAAARAILQPKEEKTLIVLDVGAVSTGVAIFDKGDLKLTSTISTGAKMIEEISEKAEGEEEKLKREVKEKLESKITPPPPQSSSVGNLAALVPVAEGVNHLIKYYQARIRGGSKIEEIRITGGGANLVGISAYVGRQTGIKTVVGNPFINLLPNCKKILGPAQARVLSVAIGAALGEI